MKVVNTVPPNFEAIAKKFNIMGKAVVFTYGQILYNPRGLSIPANLMKHEETHARQQIEGAEDWWAKYLKDPKFRLEQEVEAYRVQYKYFCGNKRDPFKRAEFLQFIATELSSDMYDNLCSFDKAKELIEKE